MEGGTKLTQQGRELIDKKGQEGECAQCKRGGNLGGVEKGGGRSGGRMMHRGLGGGIIVKAPSIVWTALVIVPLSEGGC